MDSRKDTLWFIGITLVLSWLVGGLWLLDEQRTILIRLLMCVPAVVSLGCAWGFRREPPRAMGLQFPGWGFWALGLLLPFAYVAVEVALAYALRFALGRPDFITFQPEAVKGPFGLRGLAAVPAWLGFLTVGSLTWLLVAVAYRRGWQDRMRARFPQGGGVVGHLFSLVLWVPSLLLGGIPGELAEEVGWRGYLVRRWMERPAMAAAITMPVWASFHLPIIFSSTQRGHVLQNITFLASIAVAAVVFAALYMASRSVWPCALFHLSWNVFNPLLLGNVYSGHPGLFGGEVWIFNGEGIFGMVLNGLIAAWLFRRWARAPAAQPVAPGLQSP
jgi:membrane protease YdiL (CAAX protease family)